MGVGDDRSEFLISITTRPIDRKFLYKPVMIRKTYGTSNGHLRCHSDSWHTNRKTVLRP